MSKKSLKKREIKKQKTADKYAKKIIDLKAVINCSKSSDEDKFTARQKLNALPRNAHKVRLTRRCNITGRPRAVYRKFGVCRNKLREMFNEGLIPGMTKSSW